MQGSSLYAASASSPEKLGIPVTAMDTPHTHKKPTPVLGDPKSTRYWLEFRLIASFEPHCLMRSKNMGFWLTPKPAPEIAVDELSQLRKTRVDKALEDFDESLRSRVICVLEELHAIA